MREGDPRPPWGVEPTVVAVPRPAVAVVDDGWADGAACRLHDPTLFFGPNRFEPKRERIAREAAAKKVCSNCPVVDACRAHALAHGESYGVWGGLGELDRRPLLEPEQPRVARSA